MSPTMTLGQWQEAFSEAFYDKWDDADFGPHDAGSAAPWGCPWLFGSQRYSTIDAVAGLDPATAAHAFFAEVRDELAGLIEDERSYRDEA